MITVHAQPSCATCSSFSVFLEPILFKMCRSQLRDGTNSLRSMSLSPSADGLVPTPSEKTRYSEAHPITQGSVVGVVVVLEKD